jgi:hypothetical protein
MDIDFLDTPDVSREHDLAACFAIVNGRKIVVTLPLSSAERLYSDWEDVAARKIETTFAATPGWPQIWPERVDLSPADFDSF